MKKWIFLFLVLSLGSGISFGYLEPKMFCQINKQNIKISLNPVDGSRCQEYVAYVEKTMKTTAKNLITIQGYIINRQDADYWHGVKTQKLAEIDKLQAIRLNIMTSMKTFEANLLQKTVNYFLQRTLSYKTKIQRNYIAATTYTGNGGVYVSDYKALLSGQLQLFTKISQVKTIEELAPLMDTYVYLKQKLTGIYE